MEELLNNNRTILMEAAIVERLRRSSDFKLHPDLVNAPLIYDKHGKRALLDIYQEYVDIASSAEVPILLCAPTWRANYSRVNASEFPMSINVDAVKFLRGFRASQDSGISQIKIGGLIGCKNDCYQPGEGLLASESQSFHSWQINQLARGGVDYLIAETLPNVDEALGIAKEMGATGLPYIISFVVSRDGLVLDGTALPEAIGYIDSNTTVNPIGYMVNCAFPSFISPESQPKELFNRLIGYLANASSLDHCELDQADQLEADSISKWGRLMIELNRKFGVSILGGCCGTNGDHLRYIVTHKDVCN
ncbi:MAG: homocysteine S-methyltransferase family protein [Gammaproteobacteria bacterium]|nr:homocysteine S-methyltransferase family protein [Gammaproteobacteria bacterium]